MTTYAATRRWLQGAYPTLYPSEAHVLHYLFCVLGTGYRWQGGCLVSSERMTQLARKKKVRQWRMRRKQRQWHRTMACLRQWPALWRKYHRYPGRRPVASLTQLAPLCEHSPLVCLPDDVQADWWEAARQAIALARTLAPTEDDTRWLNVAAGRLWALHAAETAAHG